MSTITAPANGSAASRFTDPNAQPQRGFSGAMTTIIIGGGGSVGYGGSAAAGNSGLNSPFAHSEDRPRSDVGPSFPDRAFPDRGPDSSPYGFDQANPFGRTSDPFVPGRARNLR